MASHGEDHQQDYLEMHHHNRPHAVHSHKHPHSPRENEAEARVRLSKSSVSDSVFSRPAVDSKASEVVANENLKVRGNRSVEEKALWRDGSDYVTRCEWFKHSSTSALLITQGCGQKKIFSGGCYVSGNGSTQPSRYLVASRPYEFSDPHNHPEEGEDLEDLELTSGWRCDRGTADGTFYVVALCCDAAET